MARASRGVGYCQNPRCEDYGKGVFLLNHGPQFACPDCRHPGRVERERGMAQGSARVFREVRV
jgi:ribosomal protein S27AE